MSMVSALSDQSAYYTEAPQPQSSDFVFEDTVIRRAAAAAETPLASLAPEAEPLMPVKAESREESALSSPPPPTVVGPADSLSAAANLDVAKSPKVQDVPVTKTQDYPSPKQLVQPHVRFESPTQLLNEVTQVLFCGASGFAVCI